MSYPDADCAVIHDCGCEESAGQWLPCFGHRLAEERGRIVQPFGCFCLYHPDGTVTPCDDGFWKPCENPRRER